MDPIGISHVAFMGYPTVGYPWYLHCHMNIPNAISVLTICDEI